MSSSLLNLRSMPEFQQVMEEVKKHRPVVPVWSPTDDNTDKWKADSMTQRGFDLCLTYFGEINE